MSGVKMHSWVTMNAPCAFRMTGPETAAAVPARVMMGPAGHRDPARDGVDPRALVEERRRGEVGGHEQRRQQQEAPRRRPEHEPPGPRDDRRARPAAGRRARAAAEVEPLPAHPGVHERRRGQDQDAGPDVDVEQVEQRPVLGDQRQVPEPDDVQRRDDREADRRARSRAPQVAGKAKMAPVQSTSGSPRCSSRTA